MSVLVVDCCIRGEKSGTRKLAERFVTAAYPREDITWLNLPGEGLAPLTARDIARRDALLAAGKYDEPMLRYARQMRCAQEVVIAAPYWDWSFPSLLKVYLEHCCAVGVTFRYVGDQHVGLCRARRLTYLSTCGGFIEGEGGHMGESYVRHIAGVFGIKEVRAHHIEGLDIEPEKREALLEEGIKRILEGLKEGN